VKISQSIKKTNYCHAYVERAGLAYTKVNKLKSHRKLQHTGVNMAGASAVYKCVNAVMAEADI